MLFAFFELNNYYKNIQNEKGRFLYYYVIHIYWFYFI
jgi:hypothetical protein